MKRTIFAVVIVCLYVLLPLSVMGEDGVVTPATIDSLLTAYGQAKRDAKVTIGRQIITSCMMDDQLIRLDREINRDTPADTLHFLVWLAAERFYYNNSYFTGVKQKSTFLHARIVARPASSANGAEFDTTETDGISMPGMEVNSDDAPVYNLQGMKVEGALKPGVYIKNGRKFVVK